MRAPVLALLVAVLLVAGASATEDPINSDLISSQFFRGRLVQPRPSPHPHRPA